MFFLIMLKLPFCNKYNELLRNLHYIHFNYRGKVKLYNGQL